MASQADAVAGATAPLTPGTALDTPAEETSKPVEMSSLSPETPANETFQDAFTSIPPTPAGESAPAATPAPIETAPAARNELKRAETEPLGPATEAPIVHAPTNTGTVLSISLMLTTGARHPYKIDEKYLKNRKVEAKKPTGEFEPRELSGYQLKELIWTDWRNEWEPRPASPSSIRLIVMGRMIEDKMTLKGELKKGRRRQVVLKRLVSILLRPCLRASGLMQSCIRLPFQSLRHERRPHDRQTRRSDRRRRHSRRRQEPWQNRRHTDAR